jgi:hypothetical protein
MVQDCANCKCNTCVYKEIKTEFVCFDCLDCKDLRNHCTECSAYKYDNTLDKGLVL